MRYAIISDVHANLPALETVLDSIREESADQIICLGDIVGFHTSPRECIDLLRDNNAVCIAGNHDDGVSERLGRRFFPRECWEAIEWTRTQLTAIQMEYLRRLPKQLAIDGLGLIMHGTFESNHSYLVGSMKVAYTALRMRMAGFSLAFHGHTHHASCYRAYGRVVPISIDNLETSHPQFLSPHADYIINPGSVGEPRNGDACATYAMFDTSASQVEWRRIDYDYAGVVVRTLAVFPTHVNLHRSPNHHSWEEKRILSMEKGGNH